MRGYADLFRSAVVLGGNVARETDFIDLYNILGVEPDCALHEFKQAYRRRVLVLHPDRRKAANNDQIITDRLQRLTALYGAAMHFHQQHGRLPGALHSRARPAEAMPEAQPAPGEPSARAHASGVRHPGGLLLVAALVAVAWFWWSEGANPPSRSAVGEATSAPERPEAPTAAEAPQILRIGMDQKAVRSLEGEPVMIEGSRWEYGPSWIRFKGNRVVNWYSSALHPLHSTQESPSSAVD